MGDRCQSGLTAREAASDMVERPTAADDAVEAVFRAQWESVLRHASGLLRDPVAAEDVAQEAFVRLWTVTRDGNPPDAAGPWLSTVVTHLAIDRFRRQAVATREAARIAGPETERRSRDSDPGSVVVSRDEALRIRDALERLEPDRRRAVLLAGAGYSADEIGRELDRTASAARSLLCRARGAIRAAVGSSPGELQAVHVGRAQRM